MLDDTIHSVTQFKKRTAPKFGRARGGNMIQVDQALLTYWNGIGKKDAKNDLGLLFGVLRQCQRWLKKKYGKAESTKFFGKTLANEGFIRRRNVIANLADDVLTEIALLLATRVGVGTAHAQQRLRFDRRKLEVLRSGASRGPQSKSMSNGYGFERESYLARGKQMPISGSGIHSMTDNLNSPTSQWRQLLSPGDVAVIDPIFAKSADQLTMQDWETLERVGKNTGGGLYGDVVYMTKEERLAFIVFVDPGSGKLQDANGQDVTRDDAYAMDEYGNLFVKPNQIRASRLAKGDQDPNSIIFNHSSFNAGKNIVSAGEMRISNGVLQHIDNTSGHYKPTEENLRNCLAALVEEGLDESQADVVVAKFSGGKGHKYHYTAQTFLAGGAEYKKVAM
jgi:hypothetical protein